MAEGGVPHEAERLPTLQDFLNNQELRSLYEDPEIQMIFTEIENNPNTILQHHNHPKVQQVLRLIQSEFDRQPPPTDQGADIEQMTRPAQTDDDDIQDIIRILEQEENNSGSS